MLEIEEYFIQSVVISSILIIISTSIFYEIFRVIWGIIPSLRKRPRWLINIIMLGIFGGHTIAVWIYGFVYWTLVKYGYGNLEGHFDGSFISCVYFSATTYSSLGFGDVIPKGPIRMLVGVEVLNGLILIGWSVTFTYFAMQKFWNLHPKNDRKAKTRI